MWFLRLFSLDDKVETVYPDLKKPIVHTTGARSLNLPDFVDEASASEDFSFLQQQYDFLDCLNVANYCVVWKAKRKENWDKEFLIDSEDENSNPIVVLKIFWSIDESYAEYAGLKAMRKAGCQEVPKLYVSRDLKWTNWHLLEIEYFEGNNFAPKSCQSLRKLLVSLLQVK
jgi:hypothetical protein